MRLIYLLTDRFSMSFKDYIYYRYCMKAVFVEKPEDADIIVVSKSNLDNAYGLKSRFRNKPIYIIEMDSNLSVFMYQFIEKER
jgi:hypothetical protein